MMIREMQMCENPSHAFIHDEGISNTRNGWGAKSFGHSSCKYNTGWSSAKFVSSRSLNIVNCCKHAILRVYSLLNNNSVSNKFWSVGRIKSASSPFLGIIYKGRNRITQCSIVFSHSWNTIFLKFQMMFRRNMQDMPKQTHFIPVKVQPVSL